MNYRSAGIFLPVMLALTTILGSAAVAQVNPYLARPGERPIHIRIATCAVSGGFAHLYTALENNLFDKYGFKMEHVFIRGSAPALAALSADEIQFLYCAADATLPSLAAGVDIKLVASPLVKLPHVLVTRKEIRRVEDLKGKALGVGAGWRPERPALKSDGEKVQRSRRDNPAPRRQSDRTLSSDDGQSGSRRRDHAASRCSRQARRLQRDLPVDRFGYSLPI